MKTALRTFIEDMKTREESFIEKMNDNRISSKVTKLLHEKMIVVRFSKNFALHCARLEKFDSWQDTLLASLDNQKKYIEAELTFTRYKLRTNKSRELLQKEASLISQVGEVRRIRERVSGSM